jgi:hypothetical protein
MVTYAHRRRWIDGLAGDDDAPGLVHCANDPADITVRRKAKITISLMVASILIIVLLNSGLGVDRDETFTDLHRPEIVGESQSNAP